MNENETKVYEEFQAHWEWTDATGKTRVEPFIMPDLNGELEEYVKRYITPDIDRDFPVERSEWAADVSSGASHYYSTRDATPTPVYALSPAPRPRLNVLFFPTMASQYAHIAAIFDNDELEVGQKITLKTNITLIKDASYFLGIKDKKDVDLWIVTKRPLNNAVIDGWKTPKGAALCVLVDWRYFMRGATYAFEPFAQIPGWKRAEIKKAEKESAEQTEEQEEETPGESADEEENGEWELDPNAVVVSAEPSKPQYGISGNVFMRLFWGLFKSDLFSEEDFLTALSSAVFIEGNETSEKVKEIEEEIKAREENEEDVGDRYDALERAKEAFKRYCLGDITDKEIVAGIENRTAGPSRWTFRPGAPLLLLLDAALACYGMRIYAGDGNVRKIFVPSEDADADKVEVSPRFPPRVRFAITNNIKNARLEEVVNETVEGDDVDDRVNDYESDKYGDLRDYLDSFIDSLSSDGATGFDYYTPDDVVHHENKTHATELLRALIIQRGDSGELFDDETGFLGDWTHSEAWAAPADAVDKLLTLLQELRSDPETLATYVLKELWTDSDVAKNSADVQEFCLEDSGAFFEPTYWEHTDREYAGLGGEIDPDFSSVLPETNEQAALSCRVYTNLAVWGYVGAERKVVFPRDEKGAREIARRIAERIETLLATPERVIVYLGATSCGGLYNDCESVGARVQSIGSIHADPISLPFGGYCEEESGKNRVVKIEGDPPYINVERNADSEKIVWKLDSNVVFNLRPLSLNGVEQGAKNYRIVCAYPGDVYLDASDFALIAESSEGDSVLPDESARVKRDALSFKGINVIGVDNYQYGTRVLQPAEGFALPQIDELGGSIHVEQSEEGDELPEPYDAAFTVLLSSLYSALDSILETVEDIEQNASRPFFLKGYGQISIGKDEENKLFVQVDQPLISLHDDGDVFGQAKRFAFASPLRVDVFKDEDSATPETEIDESAERVQVYSTREITFTTPAEGGTSARTTDATIRFPKVSIESQERLFNTVVVSLDENALELKQPIVEAGFGITVKEIEGERNEYEVSSSLQFVSNGGVKIEQNESNPAIYEFTVAVESETQLFLPVAYDVQNDKFLVNWVGVNAIQGSPDTESDDSTDNPDINPEGFNEYFRVLKVEQPLYFELVPDQTADQSGEPTVCLKVDLSSGALKGAQGEKGEKGDQGEQGVKGDKGDKGDRGEKGEQGPQGVQGQQGPQGERGEQGIPGEVGPQGPQGQQGEQGLPGKDATIIVTDDDTGTITVTQFPPNVNNETEVHIAWTPQRSNAIKEPKLREAVVTGAYLGGDETPSSTPASDVKILSELGTPTTEKVLSGLTVTRKNVVSGYTSPTTDSFLKDLGTAFYSDFLTGLGTPTSAPFINSIETETKTVVTGVSLSLSDSSSSGSVAVVTAVRCVNDQIVVEYKYLSLSKTTEQVKVVKTTSSAPALTGLGTPTTAKAITNLILNANSTGYAITALGSPITEEVVSAVASDAAKEVDAITGFGAHKYAKLFKSKVPIDAKLSDAAQMPNPANLQEVVVQGTVDAGANNGGSGSEEEE